MTREPTRPVRYGHRKGNRVLTPYISGQGYLNQRIAAALDEVMRLPGEDPDVDGVFEGILLDRPLVGHARGEAVELKPPVLTEYDVVVDGRRTSHRRWLIPAFIYCRAKVGSGVEGAIRGIGHIAYIGYKGTWIQGRKIVEAWARHKARKKSGGEEVLGLAPA